MVLIDFKQTEISLIPEDWGVVKLGEECEVFSGYAFKSKDFTSQGILVVKIGNLQDGTIVLDKRTSFYPSEKLRDAQLGKYILKEGDILIALTGATTGKIAKVPKEFEGSLLNQRVGKFEIFGVRLVKDFGRHFFTSSYFQNKIQDSILRSAQGNVSPKQIANLKIPLPPLEEQQKIARILSTIQHAVEHQDKIIEAVRKLKKSLLHKLFTEGLNGEEQKETGMGRVQKSWDVVRLGNVVDFTKKPGTLNLSDFRKIPFIPMEMIPLEKLYINDHFLKSSKEITSGVYCEKGDILLAKITPSFENGKQGIIENIPHDFAFATTEVYPLKPRNNLDKLFLFYFLIKSDVREAIAGKMQGTTGRKRVPKEAVENTLIPLPSLEEQQQIAHILSTVDKKIEIEERRKITLKELFKTMLHKLMSGEIRLKGVEI